MQRVNLRVGIRFKLGEEIYKIKRLLDNNYIETDNLSFPGTAIFATSDLLKWLNEGNLAFENYINKCTETSKHEINFSSTYNDISTEIKDKNLELAKFRLKVIEPLVGKSNRTEANVKKRVQEVNYYYENPALSKEKLGFEVKKRVSVTSVYEWLKAYEESNHDNCSLIPAYHRSGGKNKRRLPSIVLDFLQSIIENSGNNGEQLTNDQIQLLLIYKIQEHKEITGEEIPIPSYSSICRIINEVPEYKTMLKKKGNRFTKNKFNPIGNGVQLTNVPLARVEIDHTQLEQVIVDDIDLRPIGKPYLTAAIDTYSKMIVGFCVSFEHPSYSTVMQCIRHIILDKSYVKEKYPIIKNDWNVYGLPKLVVVDNGPEFHSKAFEDAMFQIGTKIQYAPAKTPEWKGSIERYFRTNKLALGQIPGTSNSSICKNPDINTFDHACIPFSVFLELLHVWIIDIYSQRINKGAGGIPSKIWEEGIKLFPPAWPSNTHEIPILLGRVDRRCIRNKGVELMGLYYNSHALNRILYEFNNANDGFNEKFKVKWDPLDISTIYVFDHLFNKEWIKVPAVDQLYTKGLTEWEHKLIKKVAREKYGSVDISSLSKAQNYINATLNYWYEQIHGNRSNIAKAKRINSTTEINKTEENSGNISFRNSSTYSNGGINNMGIIPSYNEVESNVVSICQTQEKLSSRKKRKSISKNKYVQEIKNREIILDENSFNVSFD